MMSHRDLFSAPPRCLPLVIALLAGAVAGCEMGAADMVREINAARGDCTEEGLRTSDEECVRMMQRYAEMGTALIHTYIGGVKTLDMALDRMPPPRFDTTGIGLALSPEFRLGALPGAAGASPRLPIADAGMASATPSADRSNLPTGRRAGPSPRTPEDPARDRVESRYGQRDDYWGFSTGRRSGGYFGGSGAYRAPLAPWIGGGSSYGAPYGYDPRHGGYGLDAYDSRYGGYGYDSYDRRYGGYDSPYGGSYGYDPRYGGDGFGGYDPYGGAYGYGYDPYGRGYGYNGYDPRYGAPYGYGGYDSRYGGYGPGGYDPYGGYGYGAYDPRSAGGYGYGVYDDCYDGRMGYNGYDPRYGGAYGFDPRCGGLEASRAYGDAGYGAGDPYAGDDADMYGDGAEDPYEEWPRADAPSAEAAPARPAPHQPGILLPPSERLRRPWLND